LRNLTTLFIFFETLGKRNASDQKDMSSNHYSLKFCCGVLLRIWVAFVWFAPARVSAVDIGFANSAGLVAVPVTITNHSGEAVSGVKGGQFLVLDDGEVRPVVSLERDLRPLSAVVVVDTSARMGSSMEQIQLALGKFLTSAGPLEETALITFSGQPTLVNDFTHDFTPLISKLVPGRGAGDSALNDALLQALQVLRRGHNPRKALVVITDGSDNHSRHVSELMNAVRDVDVQVYGVSIHYRPFSMKRFGSGLLQSLAEESGGLSFEIPSAKPLPKVIERIAAATNDLYRIGFEPRAEGGRRWHKIQVRLSDPNLGGLKINAKSGYMPSGLQ
jgi:Ca-activated chloride channel family protein